MCDCHVIQSERYERQRSYSDDEDQYDVMYENETPLMDTELARTKESQPPRVGSRPKVCVCVCVCVHVPGRR